jgi:hypothetical protein
MLEGSEQAVEGPTLVQPDDDQVVQFLPLIVEAEDRQARRDLGWTGELVVRGGTSRGWPPLPGQPLAADWRL